MAVSRFFTKNNLKILPKPMNTMLTIFTGDCCLAWFFIYILRVSLSDIKVYRKRYAQIKRLSESAMAVLNCFKSSPEKRLKVAGIVNETGLPRRTVQYALQTLTKNEFIQKLGQGAGTRYQLVF